MTHLRTRLIAGLLVLALAACQSAEERAEERYQSALSLIAEGDVERAMVELRNVFDLDGRHREARSLYASTLVERGRAEQAYGQYLRLVEQYPDDLPGLVALAGLALERGDWAAVRRYGGHARTLAPEDPEVRVLATSIDYADALEAEDAAARRAAVEAALALLEERPAALSLHRVAIDGAMRDEDTDLLVARFDAALAAVPEDRALHDARIRVLAGLHDTEALEAALRARAARFADDDATMGALVGFLSGTGRDADARALLEGHVEAAADPETRAARQVMLVGFVLQSGGRAAALEAIDAALDGADGGEGRALRELRAQLRFEQGETDAAIAELEALIAEGDAGLEADDTRIVLARMLEATGNRVGAQRLVAEVLESDPSQVGALKLQAAWDVAADQVDVAISRLRTALDAAPQDTEAMALLARAHLRNGDRALARDVLSLAVDVSGRAPDETLRYVELIVEEGRLLAAEEALIAALRLRRDDLRLLLSLADVYRRLEDWTRAADVERSLRGLGTPEGVQAADGLQAVRLAAEGRNEEATAFLEDLSEGQDDDLALRVAVLRARLASGDAQGARAYADALLAEDPDDPIRRLAHAATLQALGDAAAAETGYRAILADDPGRENVWMSLIRTLYAQGDVAGAEAVLDEALAALPEGPNLLWSRASLLERDGDREGALAVYETLYEIAPDSFVVANNLASLLSTLRDDDESLERAWTVARRLRGTDMPAFQDTYGWLAYRRGDHAAALEYLEPAAAGLPRDPAVQYHLGKTYLALGRRPEAAEQFRRALAIEVPGSPPPQVARARAELEALDAADPETPPAGAGE